MPLSAESRGALERGIESAKTQPPVALGDFTQYAVDEQVRVTPALRLYPDPVLNTVCEPVRIGNFDRYWARDLFGIMTSVMNDANGIGLAANQVGVTKCAIVMKTANHGTIRLLNPRIASRTGNRVKFTEGCLSVPGVTRQIYRNWRIKLCGYDENATLRVYDLRGVESSCAQHEMAHLEGKTLMDYPDA